MWSYLYDGKPIPLPNVNWLHDRFTLQLRWEDYESIDENQPGPRPAHQDYKAKFMGTMDVGKGGLQLHLWGSGKPELAEKLYRDNKALMKDAGLALEDF